MDGNMGGSVMTGLPIQAGSSSKPCWRPLSESPVYAQYLLGFPITAIILLVGYAVYGAIFAPFL